MKKETMSCHSRIISHNAGLVPRTPSGILLCFVLLNSVSTQSNISSLLSTGVSSSNVVSAEFLPSLGGSLCLPTIQTQSHLFTWIQLLAICYDLKLYFSHPDHKLRIMYLTAYWVFPTGCHTHTQMQPVPLSSSFSPSSTAIPTCSSYAYVYEYD